MTQTDGQRARYVRELKGLSRMDVVLKLEGRLSERTILRIERDDPTVGQKYLDIYGDFLDLRLRKKAAS